MHNSKFIEELIQKHEEILAILKRFAAGEDSAAEKIPAKLLASSSTYEPLSSPQQGRSASPHSLLDQLEK